MRKSPYQKRPHRYGELYQAWRRAILANDHGEAARLGRKHSLAHDLRPLKGNGRPSHA